MIACSKQVSVCTSHDISPVIPRPMASLPPDVPMTVHVRHFPPGTSKWNKIEHRLFSFISKNWKGVPLESLEIIVNLIGSTTNSKGLNVRFIADTWEYETGREVPDHKFVSINIALSEWRGDWNYTIAPRD